MKILVGIYNSHNRNYVVRIFKNKNETGRPHPFPFPSIRKHLLSIRAPLHSPPGRHILMAPNKNENRMGFLLNIVESVMAATHSLGSTSSGRLVEVSQWLRYACGVEHGLLNNTV